MDDAARTAIDLHADAVNKRDVDAYRGTMCFPFTYQNYNGVALTIETAEDCGVKDPLPWDIIARTDPQWSHTQFDTVIELIRSATSAVFQISFRRVDKSGETSELFDAVWIAVRRDGQWGVQFRHNLGQRRDAES
ncbi:MAG: hypothetical protein HOI95_20195 [Chromatiales bacterium]|jgi:hypothetical protein|nr:hypothetical protein [Chromatiales bacterium]